MVRHHIAQGTRLFIERRAVFNSYRLSGVDLNIVDVVPVRVQNILVFRFSNSLFEPVRTSNDMSASLRGK